MDTLHVSCAAEGAYVAHSAAMLHSVLAHRGPLAVHVHYLHGPRLDALDRARLGQTVEDGGGTISFLEVADAKLAGLPPSERFTAAMWHRLFLPELAPELSRALYLDVDTIVCSGLEPLWRTELGDNWLGAVTNAFQPNHRGRVSQLGLPEASVYFNSGVLLLNLELMRREAVTAQLMELVSARGTELEWPDQDALNLVMHRRRLPLAPRWNAMNALWRDWSRGTFGRLERRRARRKPGIRHFEGPAANKPWHPDCTEAHRELYWEHRAGTPWSGEAVSA